MVFGNTLDSSRAVDNFLSENQISTVNYHGEVPAEQRVENLNKFKSDEDDCPTLVCTDLAARGPDLDVDRVIMFDFPLNSIDYLHRTGRTARMGAKGKVTSLVAKRDTTLATRIEEAIRKNESLEAISKESLGRETARTQITQQKGKNSKLVKVSRTKNTSTVRATSRKTPKKPSALKVSESSSSVNTGSRKASQPLKSAKAGGIQVKKSVRSSSSVSLKKASAGKKQTSKRNSGVFGFRGRRSLKQEGITILNLHLNMYKTIK